MYLGQIQKGPMIEAILIVIYKILSLHAKKYMNDLERYRIMQNF